MGLETPRSCLALIRLHKEEVDRSHIMEKIQKALMEMIEKVDLGNITWDRVRQAMSDDSQMLQLVRHW
jgi:hypothetical protein